MLCAMIFLTMSWNTSIVSRAESGVYIYIDDVTYTQIFSDIYSNDSGRDLSPFYWRKVLDFSGLLFSIPDTHAGDEYVVRFKMKDLDIEPIFDTMGYVFNFPDMYLSTDRMYDSNYTDLHEFYFKSNEFVESLSPDLKGLNFKDDYIFEFTVRASSGSTDIYFYMPSFATYMYMVPAISKGSYWSDYLCRASIVAYDISFEKLVGGDELLDEAKKQTQIQEETKETTKNIFERISEFFAGFFDGIINAFLSLFVPDDDFFSDYFARLNDFFSEKLGFLYVPVELLVDVIEGISNASGSPPGIEFPGIEWDGQYIIEPQTFSFSSIFGEMPGLQDAIYLGTDIIMIGAVLLLLQNKLKEVLEK